MYLQHHLAKWKENEFSIFLIQIINTTVFVIGATS